MTSYAEFLEKKSKKFTGDGVTVSDGDICESLFSFQRAIVRWCLSKGRSCVFAGTGLGKTRIQLEYLRHLGGTRLIVAPLAVAGQTVVEAGAIGMRISHVKNESDITIGGVNIVNYDRLELFDDVAVDAVVLDESSILKNHAGAFRNYVTDRFRHTQFKLCATATPSPNDYMELGTHSEFIGAMTRAEMLATFFMHDGGDTSQWRLKRHARADFWKWLSSWACVLSHPRDIGFEQDGYDLPELTIIDHIVDAGHDAFGGLFGGGAVSATTLHSTLRDSASERVTRTAEIVAHEPDMQWLVWCNSEVEQDLIERAIPGIASVRGRDTQESKEDRLLGFASGKYQKLVTKPSIAGFGMNWQNCNRIAFCGVTYSFEQTYQAIRRCWRFGQTAPVHTHIITCAGTDAVKAALQAKQSAFEDMAVEMKRWCVSEVCR